MAPELPAGYVRRAALLQRLEGLLKRRLTVLQAPGGFGKTTVLADFARGVKEQGLIAGWISLDGDDTPNLFGSYLAAALEHAGLDVALLGEHDAWSSSPAVQQMGMLAGAIERHAAPCLLVLDEVDRLPRRTVRLLELLAKRAPHNLHLAMAFRSNPGLDLATYVLDDQAVVVGAGDLRFSRADIARFFHDLPRRDLSAVEERTAGWPVALMVDRNMRAGGAVGRDPDAAGLAENYVGVRLLRDLSAEDRACLLDLAVFDWIDADLVDDVLGSDDTWVRVAALPALDGLLLPIDSDRTVRRLHPLLRDYCLNLLSVEDRGRRRALHRRIALALSRRGQLTPAWRHAAESGDARLVGELIEGFGVFQLWLREGVARLISAGRFLTPEILALHPRLELLQCIILRLSSKFDEARALFEAIERKTDGFSRDRDGGDGDALTIDGIFTRGWLAGGGGPLSPDEIDSRLPASGGTADGDERARTISCARHTVLCLVCHERAHFERSNQHVVQAQAHFSEDMRFGRVFVNICRGMSAMAEGRVQEAADSYRRARQVAKKFLPSEPCVTMSTDVLAIELDLERNREKAIHRRTLDAMTELPGVWTEVYIAATEVSAELTLAQYGGDAVIQLLTRTVDNVRAMGRDSLSQVMPALLAYYLVRVGRSGEAGRVWDGNRLPCGISELVDLDRRSWRAMEALSCARIRLLSEQGEDAAACELARRLCGAASERGLTRTVLRGLALSMVVAERAGEQERALAALVEFLYLTRDVDYVRPLVRHREVSRTVLRRLLGADLDEDTRRAAESALVQVDGPAPGATPVFSARELEVLAEIRDGLRNKEVGGRLGITDEGVRYHLKNIYRKTGLTSRTEAVRYAQSLGVLP